MYFHISAKKRHSKTGISIGGVEKFAWYLNKAIPDLQVVAFEDHPEWIKNGGLPDYRKAELLNKWLLESGTVGASDTVIVDGYWGLGLEGRVDRLISVCHGSYAGRYIQSLIYPWGEVVAEVEMNAQKEMWDAHGVEIVAVGKESAQELHTIGVTNDITVIYHGIDLDVYKPGSDRVCKMHAATSPRKGADLISLLNKEGYEIEFMSERSGRFEREAKRLGEAIVLVAPTRHEGNSYLLIEALACNTPLLTYATGLATEMDDRCGIVTGDLHGANLIRWLDTMEGMWDRFDARGWALENCRYGNFEKSWRTYLGYTCSNLHEG